jgi:hypothetical protein
VPRHSNAGSRLRYDLGVPTRLRSAILKAPRSADVMRRYGVAALRQRVIARGFASRDYLSIGVPADDILVAGDQGPFRPTSTFRPTSRLDPGMLTVNWLIDVVTPRSGGWSSS